MIVLKNSQITILWFITLFLFIQLSSLFFLPIEKAWLNYSLMFLYVMILLLSSSSNNFIILLLISIVYGFGLTFYSYLTGFSFETQFIFIIMHILLTASLLLLWLLYDRLKKTMEEAITLKSKIKNLEKYAEMPNLLSFNEFISQARVLITGLKRRNEVSYLLKIKPLGDETTHKSVLHSVTRIALNTIRVNYDLITKNEDETLLIFLQNTSKAGTDNFIKRLTENIQKDFLTTPVSFEVTVVETIETIQHQHMKVTTL